MAEQPHSCPCGCGDEIAAERLACKAGWFHLPQDLRRRINRAWNARQWGGPGAREAHAEAVRDALRYYSEHPRLGHA